MKRVIAAAVFLILAGGLYGQSLAELSRREKARRESLKGKQAKVVTNTDLAQVKKRPAILVVPSEPVPPEGAAAADGQPSPGADVASDPDVMVPTVIDNGPALAGPAAPVAPTSVKDLEAKLKAAEDLVGLLTDKMNMLITQASNINGLNPRETVMQQIDETNKRLAEARDEVENLKTRLKDAGKKRPESR